MGAKRVIFLAVLFLGQAPLLWAWGPTGHRITGEIAEKRLSASARQKISALLEGHSLAEMSTWADEMRSDPSHDAWKPWHYVSIEDGQTYASSLKSPEGDLLNALQVLEKKLKDPKTPVDAKKEALKLWIHFLGDLHQPLHIGRQADHGGNSIQVFWFRERTNLHSIWDQALIDFEKLSFTEWVRFLDSPSSAPSSAWEKGSIIAWAEESLAFREKVYAFSGGDKKSKREFPRLDYDYRFKQLPLLKEQLLKAGIRLAFTLNQFFK